MNVASAPITEAELAALFADRPVVTDAEQWLALHDRGRDWTDARVRREAFQSLRAAGCRKALDHHRGVHTFTFGDGSTLSVSRNGIEA